MKTWFFPAGLYLLAFALGSLPLERLTTHRWLKIVLRLFKGAIPAIIAMPWLAEAWLTALNLDPSLVSPTLAWWIVLIAVLGDTYSPWLRFKGGTGVIVGLGGLFVVSPWAAVAGIIGYLLGGLAAPQPPAREVVPVLAGILAATSAHLVLFPIGPEIWVAVLMVFVFLIRYEDRIDQALEGPAPSV